MVRNWDDPPGTGSIPSHSPLCFFFQRGDGDLVTVAFRAMGAVSGAKSALWPWLGVLASLSVTLTVYILVRALLPAGVVQVDGRNPAPVDMELIWQTSHYLQGFGFHTSQVVQDFFHQQYVGLCGGRVVWLVFLDTSILGRWKTTWQGHQVGHISNTKDLNRSTSYCWWKKSCTTWPPGMYKGINYQPQLVIAGFLNHQQYHFLLGEFEFKFSFCLRHPTQTQEGIGKESSLKYGSESRCIHSLMSEIGGLNCPK